MNKSNFELKDLKENAEYVKDLNERQKSFKATLPELKTLNQHQQPRNQKNRRR